MEANNTLATEKRGRGRPRKHPVKVAAPGEMKRGRGRPRKYPIMEKEKTASGEFRPVVKKVESGHLMKHLLAYFTKLLVIHSELSKDAGKHGVVFNRLKNLDFQMAEICKTVLTGECSLTALEEKAVSE